MKNLTTNKLDQILEKGRNEKRGMRVTVVVNGVVRLPVDEANVATNEEANELEIRVDTGARLAEPSGQDKMTAAIQAFNTRGKFILRSGGTLHESVPLPSGVGERVTLDNMTFERRSVTSDGIAVYHEVAP